MTTQLESTVVNGVDTAVLQETVDQLKADPDLGKAKIRVSNKWVDGNHNCTTVKGFYVAKQEHSHKQPFELHADEPTLLAGDDNHANPVEHMLNALAGCLTTSLVAHAAVRGIHIEELESQIEGDIDLNGFLGLSEDVPKGYTNIRVTFKVKTDEQNLDRLKSLALFSPVFNTITQGAQVDVQVQPK